MKTNQMNMLQQEQILQTKKRTFRCLKCTRFAIRPVVTQCGHMFCWECLYRSSLQAAKCPYCKSPCAPEECYTVYTQHHEEEQSQNDAPESVVLPPRPEAKHRMKIVNPNMIGIGMPLAANSLPSNVNKGKMLAGHVYMSPLGVNSFSSIEDESPEDEDYQQGQKYKLRMHLAIVCTILVVVYFLVR